MKKKLAFAGSLILILTVVFLCLFVYAKIRNDFIMQTKRNLRIVDQYVENEISRSYTNSNQTEMSGSDYAAIIKDMLAVPEDMNKRDLRITVLDMSGNVMADSAYDLSKLNLHRARPEVYAVIKGADEAFAVRRSDTQKTEVLYVAFKSAQPNTIIRVSYTLDYLNQVKRTFFKVGFTALMLSLLIYFVCLSYFLKQQSKTLISYQSSFSKLAQGDLAARLSENRHTNREFKSFARHFNMAMETFEKQYRDMQNNRTWLEIMVNSLDEPLTVVNAELNVIYTNRYAKSLFNRYIDPQAHPYPFVLLTHEEDLDDLILTVLNHGETVRREYVLQTAEANNAFQVIMSPIDEQHVIVLFHDLSLEYEIRNLRSGFVANVTHELKTPLTSIRGFVETLRYHEKEVSADQTEKFLAIIDLEAERLERLIDDILDLSEIENSGIDYQAGNFDLIELLDECLIQLDDQAMAKNISIITNDEPIFLQVHANRDRIKQIFLNLIDNAVKYNRIGGKVWIEINKIDTYVYIIVKDNGIGFNQEAAKRVFERFYRVDKSRSRELGGTGLGLSIVKHIAFLYEGEASVQSKPNEGTTFTVKLKI